MEKKKYSLSKRSFRKLAANKLALVGLTMIVVVSILCFGAPLFTNSVPSEINTADKFAEASAKHPLGTDALGRDIWSRLLYGGRLSIIIGVVSSLSAAIIGTVLGCVSGYYGGKVDWLLIYISEIFSCFPQILLVLVVMAFVGQGIFIMILIFALTGWTATMRLVRSRILSLKTEPYVDSCKVNNVKNIAIMFKHLLPNTMGIIILSFTLSVAGYILAEAGLSFLGLGVPKGIPTWGNMLNAARSLNIMQVHPILWIAPGIAISLIVLGINFLGDGLRDVYDVTQ